MKSTRTELHNLRRRVALAEQAIFSATEAEKRDARVRYVIKYRPKISKEKTHGS